MTEFVVATADDVTEYAQRFGVLKAFGAPKKMTPPHRGVKNPQILLNAAVHDDPQVRVGAAQNPRTPPVVLEYLSADDNPTVRAAVGSNDRCPPAVLLRLVGDPVRAVTGPARNHPNLPVNEIPVVDQDSALLVAGHPSVTPSVLTVLHHEWADDELVVATIAANPNWTEPRTTDGVA